MSFCIRLYPPLNTSVACATILPLGSTALTRHLWSWDYNPNLLDADPIGKSRGNIIPSMGKASDIPLARKTSQVCDFYTKLRFRMGRFTHEYRVLPVQNAGQHLQFLQTGTFPMAQNVRTRARMCNEKQAQNLLCTIQTFGASTTTKSTNQSLSEYRMNEYGYR